MASNLDLLAALMEPFTGEGVTPEDQEPLGGHMRSMLAQVADPGMETLMLAPDPTFHQEHKGIDGFIEAWIDWLSPFQSYRLVVDDVIDQGDQIVTLVRQYATPVGGSVEVENVGSAIWRFKNGLIAGVEFHLDRETGLRAAGIDPASVESQSSQA